MMLNAPEENQNNMEVDSQMDSHSQTGQIEEERLSNEPQLPNHSHDTGGQPAHGEIDDNDNMSHIGSPLHLILHLHASLTLE